MPETSVPISDSNPIPAMPPPEPTAPVDPVVPAGRPDPTAAEPTPAPVHADPAIAALAGMGLEKFKSVEDLANSYIALEQRLSKAPEAPPLPTEPADTGGLSPEVFTAAQSELLASGGYSPETRQTLLSMGVPEETLKFTEDAVTGMGQLYVYQMVQEVGSPTDFAEMQLWAENALDPDSLQGFKEAIQTGDIEVAMPYVKGVAARWRESVSEPGHQIEGNAQAPDVVPFRSREEMVAAMSDPRYGLETSGIGDDAYRNEVIARIDAGRRAGFL